MSKWITDRLPTQEDAPYGEVLVSGRYTVCEANIEDVALGDPWMPMPAPYVKPKRWKVRWHNELGLWMLTDNDFTQMHLPLLKLGDVDVAWQIANIYNEAMP